MAETLEIPQQTQEGILPSPTNTQQPQQQYPPSKKLYDGLVLAKKAMIWLITGLPSDVVTVSSHKKYSCICAFFSL